MNTDRGTTACAACGIMFDQHPGTGRKRRYCTIDCRRTAERARPRTSTGTPRRAPAPEPVRATAAAELATLLRTFAGAVEDAGRARAVLRVRLSYTDRDSGRIVRYGAVVGADRPAREPRGTHTVGAGGEPATTHASRRLAAALRLWCERDGAPVDRLARRAGIDGRRLAELLNGEQRLPSWPSVHSLVATVGGDVDGARALWEVACDLDHRPNRSREDLTRLLAAALRVLRDTRPSRPDAREPDSVAPGGTKDRPCAETVPDRAALAATSAELDVPVDVLRRLWSDAHAADPGPLGRRRAGRHHRDGER
ncbi:hypothetical protein [Embleya sp. NPDC050493]|uniref:hypothetical protein n=1 Tax=Embleya sp. NPDC050493 TaxID=3363989 RepID=UPI0037AE5F2B